MYIQYSVRHKSGVEIKLIHRPVGGYLTVAIRRDFEKFLESGAQHKWTYSFRDRMDNVANTNIDYTIDFKDIASITEQEMT